MKTTVWTVMIGLGAAALLGGCNQQKPSAPNSTGDATNAAVAAATNTAGAGTNVLSSENARVSYAIGMSVGHNLMNVKNQGYDVDDALVARGIHEMLSGGTTLLTAEQMQQTLMTFQKEMVAQQQKKRQELAAKDKAEGEAFLATNKNNPGVVTLTNGLQYRVITNGTSPVPEPNDIVTVNYRGTLLDGTEFDSTSKRGQPAKFRVNGVIRGWTDALMRMNVGSKWQLFIPPELAYGEMGQRNIPPNAVLVFDLELVSTEAPPSAPKTAEPLTSDIIKVPSAEELKKGAKIEVIKSEDVKKMQQQ